MSDAVIGSSSRKQYQDFQTPIKKAAANAAAKVRRWIKELQINVSEQRGDKAKKSIYPKSVANRVRLQRSGLGVFRHVPGKHAQNKRLSL